MIAAVQRGGPDSALDLRIKELAILRTSTRNRCFFCTQHNIRLGRLVDVSDEQIVAVSGEEPEESGLFDEKEQAAIAWADRVTRNEAHADPAAYARLQECYSDQEIVELTLAACLFNFLNRFNDSMWIELDEGAQPGAQLFVDPAAFRRYAETMFPPEPA
jgi:alkylhydroperoxidase family enzyme